MGVGGRPCTFAYGHLHPRVPTAAICRAARLPPTAWPAQQHHRSWQLSAAAAATTAPHVAQSPMVVPLNADTADHAAASCSSVTAPSVMVGACATASSAAAPTPSASAADQQHSRPGRQSPDGVFPQLQAARDWSAIAALVNCSTSGLCSWGPGTIATALMRLAKVAPKPPAHKAQTRAYAALQQQLLAAAVQATPYCGPRELSSMLWAAAKLESEPSRLQLQPLWQALVEQLAGSSNSSSSYTATPLVADEGGMYSMMASSHQRGTQLPLEPAAAGAAAAAGRYGSAAVYTSQDVSMALWAVATLGWNIPSQQLNILLTAAAAQLPSSSPQAVSNVLWAAARLQGTPGGESLAALAAAAERLLPQMTPQGVANVLWAFARLRHAPSRTFCDVLWRVTAPQLAAMPPHAATGILWAAATLQLQPPAAWLQQWQGDTLAVLPRANAQDLANAIWAHGCAGWRPPVPWLSAWLTASRAQLDSCNARELGCMLWGLAKLRAVPPLPWMEQWLRCMAAQMHSFCAPSLAMSAWALAKLRITPSSAWMRHLLAAAEAQLPALGAQEMANLVWALAVLRVTPPKSWMGSFLAQASASVSSFNSLELSLLAWSSARLGYLPPRAWLDNLLTHGIDQLDGYGVGPATMLLWALARLQKTPEYPNRRLVQPFIAAAEPLLPTCRPKELSLLLWSCSRLGMPPSNSWLRSYCTAATQQLPAARMSDVGLMIWAFGRMRRPPTQPLLQGLLDAAQQRMPGSSVRELAAFSHGIALMLKMVSADMRALDQHTVRHAGAAARRGEAQPPQQQQHGELLKTRYAWEGLSAQGQLLSLRQRHQLLQRVRQHPCWQQQWLPATEAWLVQLSQQKLASAEVVVRVSPAAVSLQQAQQKTAAPALPTTPSPSTNGSKDTSSSSSSSSSSSRSGSTSSHASCETTAGAANQRAEVMTVLTSAAVLRLQPSPAWVSAACEVVAADWQEWPAEQLTGCIWALSSLQQPLPEGWLRTAVVVLKTQVHRLGAAPMQHLAVAIACQQKQGRLEDSVRNEWRHLRQLWTVVQGRS